MEQIEGVLGAGKLGVDDRIGGDAAQRVGEVPDRLHWEEMVSWSPWAMKNGGAPGLA
jgi:hypothetical protein